MYTYVVPKLYTSTNEGQKGRKHPQYDDDEWKIYKLFDQVAITSAWALLLMSWLGPIARAPCCDPCVFNSGTTTSPIVVFMETRDPRCEYHEKWDTYASFGGSVSEPCRAGCNCRNIRGQGSSNVQTELERQQQHQEEGSQNEEGWVHDIFCV